MSTYATVEDAQRLVRKFHESAGQLTLTDPASERPLAVRDAACRANLIEEEAQETVEAILAGDLVEACDGLCDLIYVCLGAAEVFNVDLGPLFAEVHRSNMTKVPFVKREDGKITKGPNFQGPDIAGELRKQGWDGK